MPEVISEVEPGRYVVEATGEVVEPGSSTGDLVMLLGWLDDAEAEVKRRKRIVGEWLLERMDAEALWTIHASGFSASAPSPEAAYGWDADAVRRVTTDLVAEGVITEGARERCFVAPRPPGVSKRGIDAVLKVLPDEARARLEGCRTRGVRSVRISPEG